MSKIKDLIDIINTIQESYKYCIENNYDITDDEKLLGEFFKKLWNEIIDSGLFLRQDLVEISLGSRNRGRHIKYIKAEEFKVQFYPKSIVCVFRNDNTSRIEIFTDKIK